MELPKIDETVTIGQVNLKFYENGTVRIVDAVSGRAVDIPKQNVNAVAKAITKRQPKTTKDRDAFNRAFAGEAL